MLSRSARLGIGGVVGNGQGIGVKHPYGLALAAHLNLVFASDDHNKTFCYSSPHDFSFWWRTAVSVLPHAEPEYALEAVSPQRISAVRIFGQTDKFSLYISLCLQS